MYLLRSFPTFRYRIMIYTMLNANLDNICGFIGTFYQGGKIR